MEPTPEQLEMLQFVENYADKYGVEIVTLDDMDAAIVGVVESGMVSPRLAYDYNKCVEIILERDGGIRADAAEFVDHNMVNGDVRDDWPVFLFRPEAKA
jgi:hypothetical protein